MSHLSSNAAGDPYRYGVYLRPDPHTCWAISTITAQLLAQYGFLSAGAFPPHATLVGSQHIPGDPARIVEAVTPAVEQLSQFTVHNAGIRRQGVGFVYDVHHLGDGTSVNEDLVNLASIVNAATGPLVRPAPNPRPEHVFDPTTYRAHLSLASHDLYQRPDLHTEVEEYLQRLPIDHPSTFRADTVALYRTSSDDWTGRWWHTLKWTHLHTWKI